MPKLNKKQRIQRSNVERAEQFAPSTAEEYVNLVEIQKRIDNQLKEVDKLMLLVQRSSTLSRDHLSNPTFSRLRDCYLYCRRHITSKINLLS